MMTLRFIVNVPNLVDLVGRHFRRVPIGVGHRPSLLLFLPLYPDPRGLSMPFVSGLLEAGEDPLDGVLEKDPPLFFLARQTLLDHCRE